MYTLKYWESPKCKQWKKDVVFLFLVPLTLPVPWLPNKLRRTYICAAQQMVVKDTAHTCNSKAGYSPPGTSCRWEKRTTKEKNIPKASRKRHTNTFIHWDMFGSETDWIGNHKRDNGRGKVDNNLLRGCPKLVSNILQLSSWQWQVLSRKEGIYSEI